MYASQGESYLTVESIADELRSRLTVSKEYEGYFMALCPAHDNMNTQSPALSVKVYDDHVGVRCHGNPSCSTDAILAALNMTKADLKLSARLIPNGATCSSGNNRETRRSEVYEYLAPNGGPHMAVKRMPDKRFFQFRYDTQRKGYVKGLGDLKPVLYHADRLANEYDRSKPLFIVEGEKDADRLICEELQATTNPMGAGKWRDEYTDQLGGFEDVYVIPDNDEAGEKHAQRVKASIPGAKIIRLTGLPLKGDVSDWLDAGHTVEELLEIAHSAAGTSVASGAKRQNAETGRRRNQADRLIDYALESGVDLFVDQVGAPHVQLGAEALPLNTRAYNWLRNIIWEAENTSVSSDALKAATGTLAAFAVKRGVVRQLHIRAAFCNGAVYYQTGPGRTVKIDRNGWALIDAAAAPVMFRSIVNLKPLPDPIPGVGLYGLDALERLINLRTERDKRLLRAYAVTVPLSHIARPILQTTGVHGSGKTTAGRVIKRLFDPTAPESVRPEPRDFLQKASHCYMTMLDNQNSLPEWAVDTLCRLVTGEADSKRSLYTDDEDFIYEMRRAVILNGINPPTERGDAQDRTLPIELDRIPDDRRRSEEQLWAEFEAEHGRLLGAIFDALAQTLKVKATLQLDRRPRLADWGEYAASAYRVFGWSERQFFEDWGEVVKVQNQDTLGGSPVAQAILRFMEGRTRWTGHASDLHARLEVEAGELNINTKREKAWPKSPNWLWRRVREVLPMLVAFGIQADQYHGETGSVITLESFGNDPDSDPDSIASDAVSDAVRKNNAYASASNSTDNTESEHEHSFIPRTEEGKGEDGAEHGQGEEEEKS